MNAIVEERLRILGPRGALAAALTHPERDIIAGALVLNPHPLMGGTMEQPLARALAEALAGAGFAALRFEYSGVGDSEGERIDTADAMAKFWATGQIGKDPTFIEDAQAAAGWLACATGKPFVVAGYSFGAWCATRLEAPSAPAALALIAPTFDRHDFAPILASAAPAIAILCKHDFASDAQQAEVFLRTRAAETEVRRFDTDHFFRGIEAQVASVCAGFLAERVCAGGAA